MGFTRQEKYGTRVDLESQHQRSFARRHSMQRGQGSDSNEAAKAHTNRLHLSCMIFQPSESKREITFIIHTLSARATLPGQVFMGLVCK